MPGIDTVKKYETPEGVVLRLKIAGPVPRACAWLIDMMIRSVLYIIIAIILGFLKHTGQGLFLICIFLIEWFYPVFFELYDGATPGKKTMNLLVVHDNGTPVSFKASVLRNLLRAADFFPVCYGTGLITMVFNKDFKRLGDIAAGTLVVYDSPGRVVDKITQAPAKQPPPDLRVNEQRTILDFSERSLYLSRERSIELANILYSLTGKKGEAAADELYSYASWLFKGK
ncbi:MAG: RDD family protein [Desulfobacterales bacterium]|nr:RDD family protein [Desulfobacterales bacterium]